MKVILPLVAVILLSVLFLFSGRVDTTNIIPFLEIDLGKRAKEQGANNPELRGMIGDDNLITMVAKTIRPKNNSFEQFDASEVNAVMHLGSGMVLDIEAKDAILDQGQEKARLYGDVFILSSSGYLLTTSAIESRLDVLQAQSDGTAQISGENLELTGGQMHLFTNPETEKLRIEFTKGVTLIYIPNKGVNLDD